MHTDQVINTFSGMTKTDRSGYTTPTRTTSNEAMNEKKTIPSTSMITGRRKRGRRGRGRGEGRTRKTEEQRKQQKDDVSAGADDNDDNKDEA